MSAAEPALVQLASQVHAVRYDDLPPATVRHAKALVLDTLACTLGGFRSAPAAAVRALAAESGGAPHATVLGTAQRTTMPLATLANGTMLRYLDANDYCFARDPAHPSGNLAAGLAVGERLQRDGRSFIAAMAGAYEVHLRFAGCAGTPTLWGRGWHHGTNAQFSAAAMAARLLQNDPQVTAHAMAISGSHHNTLAQLQAGEISMIKATAEAWVAKGGVEAALLAGHGVTGPLMLLEGRNGWGETVAGKLDVDALLAPFGERWRLDDTCIKPYPAVATATAPIRAALDLSPACRSRLDDVARIVVQLPAFALGTPSAHAERRYPARRESADHSFYYCVAVALLHGACGEAQFDAQTLHSPVLRALLARVELAEDAEFSALWPHTAGGGVVVHMKDGTRLESRHPYPPGHPRNPLTAAELLAKFDDYAHGLLSGTAVRKVAALVESLDEMPDVGELARALAAPDAALQ